MWNTNECRSFLKLLGLVFFLVCYGLISVAATEAGNDQQVILDFANDTFESWEEEIFAGRTDYQVVNLEGESVLSAKTAASASALYRRIDVDVSKTPYLNWSWRVDNIYPVNNPELKKNDDYPARIYVVIKEGFFPWQTKALNYVWCNQSTDKPFWPNPYTASAIMIPVECGDRHLGEWVSERVNIVDDFYRIFNRHINEVHGIAIMSDSDNTGGTAQAYYGSIYFSN